MKSQRPILFLLILGLILGSCAAPKQTVLTVMTHDYFAVSENVIQEFEQQNHVKVQFIKSGNAGSLLNQAILTKNAPIADVLYGVDSTFISRAYNADIFIPYASPELNNISSFITIDPQHRALPVDFGDVCINYDQAWFKTKAVPLPVTLEDLTNPRYKGWLVVENPSTDATGLAFLLATISHFGDPGYLDYWKELKNNGLVVVNDWGTAYYTNFSGSSGKGAQPLVVSYASSPAAEVANANPEPDTAPTGSILGKDTCFRQTEFIGILKGTKNLDLAKKFVDFMLGKSFQEDIPMQMFMYPVNKNATLPGIFTKFAQISSEPATMDPVLIAQNRDRWVQAWTEAILH